DLFTDFIESLGEEISCIRSLNRVLPALGDHLSELIQDRRPRRLPLPGELSGKAAPTALVTGPATVLHDLDEQGVAITVGRDRNDLLKVTGSGAFMPQLPAAPAVEPC